MPRVEGSDQGGATPTKTHAGGGWSTERGDISTGEICWVLCWVLCWKITEFQGSTTMAQSSCDAANAVKPWLMGDLGPAST